MVIPRGCVHPDCFNCPLPDCRMDANGAESSEINDIVKDMILKEKQHEAQYQEELLLKEHTTKRKRGRPRKYERTL